LVRYGDWIVEEPDWHEVAFRGQPLDSVEFPRLGPDYEKYMSWQDMISNHVFGYVRPRFYQSPSLVQEWITLWEHGVVQHPWWDSSVVTKVDGRPLGTVGYGGHAHIQGLRLELRPEPSSQQLPPPLPEGAIGVEWQGGSPGWVVEPDASRRVRVALNTLSEEWGGAPKWSWYAGVSVMQGFPDGHSVPDREFGGPSGVIEWPPDQPRQIGRWRSQGRRFTDETTELFVLPLTSKGETQEAIIVPTLEHVTGTKYDDTAISHTPASPPSPQQQLDQSRTWVARLYEVAVEMVARRVAYRFIYPTKGMWPYRQRQSLGASGYPYRQRQNGGNTGSHPYRQRQRGL